MNLRIDILTFQFLNATGTSDSRLNLGIFFQKIMKSHLRNKATTNAINCCTLINDAIITLLFKLTIL